MSKLSVNKFKLSWSSVFYKVLQSLFLGKGSWGIVNTNPFKFATVWLFFCNILRKKYIFVCLFRNIWQVWKLASDLVNQPFQHFRSKITWTSLYPLACFASYCCKSPTIDLTRLESGRTMKSVAMWVEPKENTPKVDALSFLYCVTLVQFRVFDSNWLFIF